MDDTAAFLSSVTEYEKRLLAIRTALEEVREPGLGLLSSDESKALFEIRADKYYDLIDDYLKRKGL